METTNTTTDNKSIKQQVNESTVSTVSPEVEDGLEKIALAISSGSMMSLKTLSKLDIQFEFDNLKKIFSGTVDFSLGNEKNENITHGWRIVHKCMLRNEKCKLNKEDYTKEYRKEFPEDFYTPWIFNITNNDGSTKTIRLTDLKEALINAKCFEEYEFIRIFMDLSNKKFK